MGEALRVDRGLVVYSFTGVGAASRQSKPSIRDILRL